MRFLQDVYTLNLHVFDNININYTNMNCDFADVPVKFVGHNRSTVFFKANLLGGFTPLTMVIWPCH